MTALFTLAVVTAETDPSNKGEKTLKAIPDQEPGVIQDVICCTADCITLPMRIIILVKVKLWIENEFEELTYNNH